MGRVSQRWGRHTAAGLVAVQVVGEVSSVPVEARTIEIACPGGTVLRLREEVSAEVLQRVIQACGRAQVEDASRNGSVRSC
jgi:hypothetical protein